MGRWRGLGAVLMGLLFLIGLVSNAWAEPKTQPAAPYLAGAVKAVKAPEVEITVTGKLVRVMAIGGETTGWAVDLDAPLEIEGNKVTRIGIDPAGWPVADFDHRRIEVVGILDKRSGVERGDYWVIVVKKMRGAAQ